MNRRSFIRLTSLGVAGVSLVGCWDSKFTRPSLHFPIHVKSNMHIGHMIFKVLKRSEDVLLETETLIVGGGIAGLATASSLGGRDFILAEMDEELGGTAGSILIGGERITQGAHYDLSYPGYYGEDGLKLLEKIGVTTFNKLKNEAQFIDTQYIISAEKEEICLSPEGFQDSPIKSGANKEDLISLIKPYIGEMKMPTRLIDSKYHYLNNLSFFEYIDKYLTHDPEFIRGIDYQMIDDYGANCSHVSALAGIHYYACRDYYGQHRPQLFSPPEGNYYFIEKMANQIDKSKLHTSRLVYKIEKKGNKYESLIYDHKNDKVIKVKSNSIVYAGQKNALKFIMPKHSDLFSNNTYAPWVVLNFKFNTSIENAEKWQNDMVGFDPRLLGFVNAKVQASEQNILTMYMCYEKDNRKEVKSLHSEADEIVSDAMGFLEQFFGDNSLRNTVEEVRIKLMGHAMPIPGKGYLFNDGNDVTRQENFFFAGVDNGRLPLMFEAMDSGIFAAKEVMNSSL
ncbi:MAG: FAD-dependent oxidoreductase [Crocinitomicaceae bacterium]|nr:FAD-dependent oxidoreductase [Crocinitomicaceae bacterium]